MLVYVCRLTIEAYASEEIPICMMVACSNTPLCIGLIWGYRVEQDAIRRIDQEYFFVSLSSEKEIPTQAFSDEYRFVI